MFLKRQAHGMRKISVILNMSDIDDFMRNRKPTGKSKLDVYTDDILTLKKYGYSNADVLLYLSEKKNITVGSATLTRFLAKHRENSLGKSGVRTIPLDEQPKKMGRFMIRRLTFLQSNGNVLSLIGKKRLTRAN